MLFLVTILFYPIVLILFLMALVNSLLKINRRN